MKNFKSESRAANLAFFSSIFLSIIKLYAAFITGSLAILSDAFNSITDILSSFSASYAVKVSKKKADSEHPYGHHSAQPVAGLIIAIFAGIVGIEVIRSSIVGLFSEKLIQYSFVAIGIMLISMIVKAIVWYRVYSASKHSGSLALKAVSIDYRNDIIVTIFALVGYFMGSFFTPVLDLIVALGIGFFIIYSAYGIGKENVMFLMGASPPKQELDRLRKIAESVEGVESSNDIRAHYIGNLIHAEVHINIDNNLNTIEGHKIGINVRKALEDLDIVERAFIHIDPAHHK